MNTPSSLTDYRKERIDYAKSCFDRFVEVCKARIAIGTMLAVTIVTLTGFGLHAKRYELLLIAAVLPIGLMLLVDTMLKSRYGAPFLFTGLSIEHDIYGEESAAMLFLRLTKEDRSAFISTIAESDRYIAYSSFRRQYARRGLRMKLPILLLVAAVELCMAYVVYARHP